MLGFEILFRLFALIFSLVICNSSADSIQCKPGFVPLNNNKCIQIFKNLTTYSAASQKCSTFGGYLVSLQNAIDNNALTTLVSTLDKPIWLGLKCTDDQNPYSCQWDDLSGVARYNNFYNGYPIVEAGQCVYMVTKGQLGGRWISGDCQTASFNFVCEVPQLNPDDNFCTFKEMGNCFYPFTNPLTEWDARTNCQKYCSDLVSVHNLNENIFVQNIFHNTTSSTYARIGGMLSSSGTFSWTDRTKWDYNNIGYSNPNLGNCTSMALHNDIIPTGKWINSYCDTKLPYICKRKDSTQCGSTPAPTVGPDRCEGIKFLNNTGSFYSPNWPNSYMGVQTQCSFVLDTPTGTQVQIQFPVFNLDSVSSIALYNHIEDANPFAILTKYSGTGWYHSSTNSMKVVFRPCTGSGCSQSDVYKWQADFKPLFS